ncbi:MAG: DUF881 domain-containing protein [Desulfitobacteriaceae bacterium]|nr:DUF881 domain-containing protein [Desulfitobacteriaceae bacterium]MDD4346068.1 DUF881 domain-containing protein [Desulfitobacteriaceae bacterium]MDD4401336.1 DUF881 domain-containing protein [Desulfitobacteriaceae bacterium]
MVWYKNARYLLTLAAFVTGILFLMLFKSNGVLGDPVTTAETTLPNLVQTELENLQLANDNEKLRQELTNYEQGQTSAMLADQQLLDAKRNAGLNSMNGPGLQITLDDSNRQAEGADTQNYVIHEAYIRQLVNILWSGGAEAISVNDQRITSDTEFFCSGPFIQINGTRQMTPYVISAIGDSHNLQSALNFHYVWDQLEDFQNQYGIIRELEVLDNVTVPAGKLRTYHYAEPVKEG